MTYDLCTHDCQGQRRLVKLGPGEKCKRCGFYRHFATPEELWKAHWSHYCEKIPPSHGLKHWWVENGALCDCCGKGLTEAKGILCYQSDGGWEYEENQAECEQDNVPTLKELAKAPATPQPLPTVDWFKKRIAYLEDLDKTHQRNALEMRDRHTKEKAHAITERESLVLRAEQYERERDWWKEQSQKSLDRQLEAAARAEHWSNEHDKELARNDLLQEKLKTMTPERSPMKKLIRFAAVLAVGYTLSAFSVPSKVASVASGLFAERAEAAGEWMALYVCQGCQESYQPKDWAAGDGAPPLCRKCGGDQYRKTVGRQWAIPGNWLKFQGSKLTRWEERGPQPARF